MSIDAFPPSMATTTTDDTLDALAGLSTSANTMPFFTGVDTAALTALTPFMRTLLDDPDLATAQATLGITGGGGGGAPTDAEYIVGSANGTLTQERVLTTTPTVAWDLATAGQAKANVPDASITEVKLGLSDVTTQNVSTTAHGLTPKLSGVVTQYLDGTGLWSVPPAGTTYTDEQAQDAVGAMLLDTATIDLTYGDGGPTLQADVKDLSITEAKLTFVDVTTKDATTSTHGLLRKLSGTATQYLDGSGAWTTPAGGGTNYWSRTVPVAPSWHTGLLAWWKLEEATGNRLDSVGTNHLVPTGTAVQVTNAAGKIGNALSMNGTSGTYLSVPDNATLSADANMSFTLSCWVYVATGGSHGFAGKGLTTGNYNGVEYMLGQFASAWNFLVGTGSSVVTVVSTFTPVLSQWCFLVGWYDHVTDIQYIQVNNGTPTQVANTLGSHNSTANFEVGRTVGFASQSLNGRVDMVGFWKRVLTAQERADLWNAGAGDDYGVGQLPSVSPLTITDQVLLAATQTTTEKLEVASGIKVGTSSGTVDGILRWTGTDMEARKGGAWVSMTAGAGGQPLDATLTALAGLATGADQLPYATGTDTFAQTTLTTFARTLLDDTSQAAMQTTLALVPGTHVQAQDAELQAIAGLVSAADRAPYFTGLGTAALATFTAAGRTLAGAADAAAQRGALALGTMAQQDAANVAITGGNATLTALSVTGNSTLTGNTGIGGAPEGGYNLAVPGLTRLGQQLYVGPPGFTVPSNVMQQIFFPMATKHGLSFTPYDTDTGGAATIRFVNTVGAGVGAITQNVTSTSYGTTSDARLKHAISALTGALAVVQALRPVHFLWNANDEPGEGFLAHELMRQVPAAVSGEPDEVNPDGTIKPQQVDHSRIVPWLVGALQDTLAQVQALTARVATLETALGG